MPYLAMLDVGVCQTLTKEQRDVSHELLTSIIIEDWERVALVLLKMSPSQDFCNQADFRQVCCRAFETCPSLCCWPDVVQ